MSEDPEPEAPPGRDLSWLSLGCGVASAIWAGIVLSPSTGSLPAWPAASVGLFALVFARLPGRALARGAGAFLGAVGMLVGLGKILALWGLLELTG